MINLDWYKQILNEIDQFVDRHQEFLTKMLSELTELKEKENSKLEQDNIVPTELISQIIKETDKIKEKEFQFGFTISEIRFTAVLIEARRGGWESDKKTEKKTTQDKLSKMVTSLTKEEMQALVKILKQ